MGEFPGKWCKLIITTCKVIWHENSNPFLFCYVRILSINIGYIVHAFLFTIIISIYSAYSETSVDLKGENFRKSQTPLASDLSGKRNGTSFIECGSFY